MKNLKEDIVRNKTIEKKLMDYGISPNQKGYYYIFEIIKNNLKTDNTLFVTNDEYEYVAKKYHTNRLCIERNIRYSIDIGYTRTKQSLIDEEFRNTISYDKCKPSNKQFLMTIINSIKYDLEMELD